MESDMEMENSNRKNQIKIKTDKCSAFMFITLCFPVSIFSTSLFTFHENEI